MSSTAKDKGDDQVGKFLRFLANDIAGSPERLQIVDAQLVHHLRTLTDGVDLDLDAPLTPIG